MDHIGNEDIRKDAHVKHVETFLENKSKVVWPLLRRERNHISAKSLDYTFLREGSEFDRKRDGGTV